MKPSNIDPTKKYDVFNPFLNKVGLFGFKIPMSNKILKFPISQIERDQFERLSEDQKFLTFTHLVRMSEKKKNAHEKRGLKF